VKNGWSIKWTVPDKEADERGPRQRLCKKTVKHVNWTGKMLRIVVY